MAKLYRRKITSFFNIPVQKDLYFYIKMPLCVDGLKNILPVSSVAFQIEVLSIPVLDKVTLMSNISEIQFIRR